MNYEMIQRLKYMPTSLNKPDILQNLLDYHLKTDALLYFVSGIGITNIFFFSVTQKCIVDIL